MKWGKRKLFNVAAAVSFVLCVATVGLWIRSYWFADTFFHSAEVGATDLNEYGIVSMRGRVMIRTIDWRFAPRERGRFIGRFGEMQASQGWTSRRHGEKPENYTIGGDRWETWFSFATDISPPSANPRDSAHTLRLVKVPHWFVALIVSPPALVWTLNAIVRKRRKRSGHCYVCRYDLRATPERCPECGTGILRGQE